MSVHIYCLSFIICRMQQRRQCRERDIPFRNFLNRPERGQIEGEIQFTNASFYGR